MEPVALENAPPPPKLNDAVAQAEQARPELKAAHYTQTSAEHTRMASIFRILPEVDLEGAYMHVTGQKFAEVDSEFVGIKANWPIWEWGRLLRAEGRVRAGGAGGDAGRRERTRSGRVQDPHPSFRWSRPPRMRSTSRRPRSPAPRRRSV